MIMDTNKAKASYGVGMSIAESLSQQDLTALDLDQVMAGMHAIFSGIEPLMSPEEAKTHQPILVFPDDKNQVI